MKSLKLLFGFFGILLSSLPSAGAAQRLTVFAAASLTDAVESLAEAYGREAGIKVDVHSAGSSILVTQIRRGAPCDILLTADLESIKPLIKSGRIGEVQPLLANRLVAIGPIESNHAQPGWLSVLTLDRIDRIVIGDPELAPAGRYAKSAFEKAGIWTRVLPKIVATMDVRAAMALVATGEVPVGIVYRTDAMLEKRVKTLFDIPPSYSGAISYPMAILKGAENPIAVDALAAFFKGAQAKVAFEKYGFEFLF